MSTYKYKYLKYKSKYINLLNQKLVGGSNVLDYPQCGFKDMLTHTNACNTIINLFILSPQILNLLFNKLDNNIELIDRGIQNFEDIKTGDNLKTILWSIIYLLKKNLRPSNNNTDLIRFIAMKIKGLQSPYRNENKYTEIETIYNFRDDIDTTDIIDLHTGLYKVFDRFFPNEYLFLDDYLSNIKQTKLDDFEKQIMALRESQAKLIEDDKVVVASYTQLMSECKQLVETGCFPIKNDELFTKISKLAEQVQQVQQTFIAAKEAYELSFHAINPARLALNTAINAYNESPTIDNETNYNNLKTAYEKTIPDSNNKYVIYENLGNELTNIWQQYTKAKTLYDTKTKTIALLNDHKIISTKNDSITAQINTIIELNNAYFKNYNKKISDIFTNYTELLKDITFNPIPSIVIIKKHDSFSIFNDTIDIKNNTYVLSSCICNIRNRQTTLLNSIGFINQENNYVIYDSFMNKIVIENWKSNLNKYNAEINTNTIYKDAYAKIEYLIYVKQ
jgi:hypothetical protein